MYILRKKSQDSLKTFSVVMSCHSTWLLNNLAWTGHLRSCQVDTSLFSGNYIKCGSILFQSRCHTVNTAFSPRPLKLVWFGGWYGWVAPNVMTPPGWSGSLPVSAAAPRPKLAGQRNLESLFLHCRFGEHLMHNHNLAWRQHMRSIQRHGKNPAKLWVQGLGAVRVRSWSWLVVPPKAARRTLKQRASYWQAVCDMCPQDSDTPNC